MYNLLPKNFSRKEAAKYLRVGLDYINGLKIPHTQDGRSIFYKKEDLDHWLNEWTGPDIFN